MTAKDNLDALHAANGSAMEVAASSASADREALVKAKADYEAVQAELEVLKDSHAKAVEELSQKLASAERQAASAQAIADEVAGLKIEKEETSNKLSELEIEILELKEAQETAEDKHSNVLDRIKSLEAELVEANSATAHALQQAKAAGEAHAQELDSVRKQHEEAAKALNEEKDKVSSELRSVQDTLERAQVALEEAKVAAETTAAEHARQTDDLHKASQSKQDELAGELKKVNKELEVRAVHFMSSLLTFVCRVKRRNMRPRSMP